MQSIQVTGPDMQRLRHLLSGSHGISSRDEGHFDTLEQELERAIELEVSDTPPDLITMHTRVRVSDFESGKSREYTLVYPWEADVTTNKVSVLAPLGTALLGYREGAQLQWRMPGGVRRLHVDKILYQPEAAQRTAKTSGYDELDRRLMGTFPASDAVARYQ